MKIQLTTASLSVIFVLVSGCQTLQEDPVIDSRGVNQAQYQRDLAECRSYADEVDSGRAVLVSAASGAVIGTAAGAILGDSNTASRGAGVGAIAGGAKAALNTSERQQRIVRRCLQGRGYRVLG